MKLCSVLISTILFTTGLTYGNGNDTTYDVDLNQSIAVTGGVYISNTSNSALLSSSVGLESVEMLAYEDINGNGLLDDEDEQVDIVNTNDDGTYALTILPKALHTTRSKITSSTDDAVQDKISGIMILDSESEPGFREIGLRFNELNIPKRAKIKTAKLKISIANHPEELIEVTVKGEANDNPTTFTDEEYNINNRAKTQATTTWLSTVVPNEYQEITIDGIESIIQEIVDRSGWNEDNSLVLTISDFLGNMYLFEGGFPAELIIGYETEEESNVAYIITPNMNSVDPSLQLVSDRYQVVKAGRNEAISNIDFQFDQAIISSTDFNTHQLNQATMEIWPKPTTGPINIQMNGIQLNQNFSVNVFSVNGTLVIAEKVNANNNNQAQCNLSKLNRGTYIVQLTDGNVFFSEKVILQ